MGFLNRIITEFVIKGGIIT